MSTDPILKQADLEAVLVTILCIQHLRFLSLFFARMRAIASRDAVEQMTGGGRVAYTGVFKSPFMPPLVFMDFPAIPALTHWAIGLPY